MAIDYSKPAKHLDESKLGELATLANLLRDKERDLAELDEKTAAVKKDIQRISEEAIPSLMEELNVASISLADGSKISVTENIYASIPAIHHDEAMGWLLANNFGDIIKLEVNGQFGKEEYELAATVRDQLLNAGAKVTSKESVHPMTLRSFLKEQIQRGISIPLEWFGARTVRKAKIT